MDARELLADLAAAGLKVTAAGDRLVIRPASKLTDDIRNALRDAKPAVLALLAADQPGDADEVSGRAPMARTEQETVRFVDLRARLLRWRWTEPEADALAARLVRSNREDDGRVTCVECRHYGPGRCRNYRLAGLSTAEVGQDLASLSQNCLGFRAIQPDG